MKRGSEPPTPVLSRHISFSSSLRSEKADVDTESPLGKLTDGLGAKDLKELREKLDNVEKERDDLREEVASLRSVQKPDALEEEEKVKVTEEERLKWQMEMENLRQELEARMEGEKEVFAKEKAALEATVSSLEEKCAELEESSRNRKAELEQNLTEAQSR